jgi:hypothetical protein
MADEEEPTKPRSRSRRPKAATATDPSGGAPETAPGERHTAPGGEGDPAGESEGEVGDGVTAGESASTGPHDPATATAAVSPDDSTDIDVTRILRALKPHDRNRYVPGTLTVHYPTRDVDYGMDGESGLRMLNVLAGASTDIDPITRDADALRSWIMIDRSDILGAQWTPEISIVPRRPTIDPPGLVDKLP